ncbi:MAG: Hsp20/alpha crystallin family protein [Yoonia sp.]|nr:Hsp20/alpha crystallin family protein [Yoonia sp.]
MSHLPISNLPASIGDSHFFPEFQREMNRLLDQFQNGFAPSDTSANEPFADALVPAIDIVETDDAIQVSAEVPGVQEADLDASISGGVLTLKGKKSADHEESDNNYHRIERRYGSFLRQISLGFTPEDNAVDAKYADGVLKIHIVKPAAARTQVRKIDISKT